jgi:predicted NAD/FAD-binding protein
VWFCGAWTRYGFHEDGLKSGLAVVEALRHA